MLLLVRPVPWAWMLFKKMLTLWLIHFTLLSSFLLSVFVGVVWQDPRPVTKAVGNSIVAAFEGSTATLTLYCSRQG